MATTPEPFRTLGFAAVDWIEHYLVHGPGDVQGQSVDLDDEFAAFVVKAYQVDRRGQRKVRRAFLSRAKGRSKSGLAAMIECFEALGPCRFDHWAEPDEVSPWGYEYEPGEPVGKPLIYVECLNVATEEGQAGNTYDAVYYMLNPETASKALVRDYGRIDVGLARTTLPNRRGFLEPISTRDDSKDGGKSTFIVADETHLWMLPRLKRLHGVMTRNLLKRKIASGWMLETSTMYGDGEDSVAEGTHSYAKMIENGRKRDRTLLFDHRQASQKWDLTKRSERLQALREAYGPAAAWMNLNAIADSWDDPQVSEAEFRRYWLNQPVTMVTVEPSKIPLARWGQLADEKSQAPLVCGWAVDVSPDRLHASVGAAGDRGDGRRVLFVVESDVGTSWIVAKLIELYDTKGLRRVSVHSRSPAASLASKIEAAGIEIDLVTDAGLGAACGLLADAVTSGEAVHLDDPLLLEALRSADTRDIGDGSWGWRRKGSANITPLVSVTLALAASHETESAFFAAWR